MLYIVEAVGLDLVKIGMARNVARRVAAVAQGCPVPVVLVKTLEGMRAEERELHVRFAEHRVRGEWFRYSPIRAEVEALQSVSVPSNVRVCVDCGGTKVNKRDDRLHASRSPRCRACASKRRAVATQRPRTTVDYPCQSCGVMRKRDASKDPPKPLCRSCGMRKAWASPGYLSSITAARVGKRRPCAHCGLTEPRVKNKYHPACWAIVCDKVA